MTTDLSFNSATPIIPENSLRATSPEEGLHLAARMARVLRSALGEVDAQPPTEVADYLRQPLPAAGSSPLAPLILSSFAIVAAANNYWR